MTHARDILRPIEERLGVPYMMWPDGGFLAGGPEDQVRGVLVSWMATVSALEAAADHGCNLILVHEPPFFSEKSEAPPYRWTTPVSPAAESSRSPNKQRRDLIQRHGFTVLQVHYGLDRYCIYDAFAAACGMARVVAGDGYEKVYELDAPLTVRDLAARAKHAAGVSGAVRVVGDPERLVRRVANLWGGVSLLANAYWWRRALDQGAEAAIGGELDEMGCHYALEAGLALIETSHVLSENIGLRQFVQDLRRRFPGLSVVFHDLPRPCWTL